MHIGKTICSNTIIVLESLRLQTLLWNVLSYIKPVLRNIVIRSPLRAGPDGANFCLCILMEADYN